MRGRQGKGGCGEKVIVKSNPVFTKPHGALSVIRKVDACVQMPRVCGAPHGAAFFI
jgi:hypothetical protein